MCGEVSKTRFIRKEQRKEIRESGKERDASKGSEKRPQKRQTQECNAMDYNQRMMCFRVLEIILQSHFVR